MRDVCALTRGAVEESDFKSLVTDSAQSEMKASTLENVDVHVTCLSHKAVNAAKHGVVPTSTSMIVQVEFSIGQLCICHIWFCASVDAKTPQILVEKFLGSNVNFARFGFMEIATT